MKLVIGVFLILVVGWYLNDDIPENYSHPWELWMMSAKMKILMDIGWVADRMGICTMHDFFNSMFVTVPEPDPRVEVMDFDGVTVRVYNLRGDIGGKRPAYIYFHGGGWVLANATSADPSMLALAAEYTDLVIYNVDYSLVPFPVPFEDSVKAVKYVINNAAKFGVDPNRVAIGGESAGGNLAAAVSLKLRDEQFKPMPGAQLLLYPALQAIDFALPSMLQSAYMPVQKRYYMAWFWSLYATGTTKYVPAMMANAHTTPEMKKTMSRTYINHDDLDKQLLYPPYDKPAGTDFGDVEMWHELEDILMDPYFSPLMADDVSGVPHTFMYTSHCDVLRDEGLLYAKRLQQAGVSVTYGECAFHALCLVVPHHPEGQRCIRDVTNYLKGTVGK